MPFVYCASWDLISDLIQLKLTNHIRDLTPAIDWNSEIITSRSTSSFTHRSKLLAHNMAEHLLRQTRGPCIRLDYVNILIHGHPYIRRVRILRENIHYVLFNSAGMHTVSVRFNSINFGWTSLNWMFVNWSLLLLSRMFVIVLQLQLEWRDRLIGWTIGRIRRPYESWCQCRYCHCGSSPSSQA